MLATETQPKQSFIDRIEAQLNAVDAPYLTPYDLFQLGLFTTREQANKFSLSGKVPAIKLSQKRILIDRQDLLAFLREQTVTGKGDA